MQFQQSVKLRQEASVFKTGLNHMASSLKNHKNKDKYTWINLKPLCDMKETRQKWPQITWLHSEEVGRKVSTAEAQVSGVGEE